MQTGYGLVWYAAERTPDHPAIVDDATDRHLTYAQLIETVDRIAAGFYERGIRYGSRVATALPNTFEHCLVLLALQRLGAVPALLNVRLSPEQLGRLVRTGKMSGALVQDNADVVREVSAALPPGSMLLQLRTGDADGVAKLAAANIDNLPPPPKPDPKDIAYIFYTSGTTGEPKGVMVAHGTTEHRIACLAPLTGLRNGAELRALGAAPLFHAIGFYLVFMVTLAYNGTYYTMSAFNPKSAVEIIDRRKISYIFAVPTMLQAITAAPNYAPMKMRSVRLVLHGGSPISPALLNTLCSEWRADVVHLYGSTEIMCPFYNHAPRLRPTTFHAGYYHRVRVVRIGGGPDDIVQPGEAGELVVDATISSTFSGYLDRPDTTQEKMRQGWYFTGDVCIRNADATFDLIGRVDDAIRSGAEAIYPEEIETVLGLHPGVQEVCAVGIPDDLWGQMVVACVVRRKPDLTWQDLDGHCLASELANFKRPRAYLFVDALPRNATNKVVRQLVKDHAVSVATTSEALYRVAA